jgi:DNA polymerase-1
VLKERLVALSRTWLGEFMLLPIHDEILFQVPDDIVPDAMEVIKQVMPVNDRFLVPLTVDTEAAKRWGAKYD